MPDVSAILDRLERDLKAAAVSRSPDRLRDRLRDGSFVYGAGSFGRGVAVLLRDQGFPCLGIIDRRAGPDLDVVAGVPAIHPGALTPALCDGRNLVVGIFNPHHDIGEVVRAARACGFADILWGADLPDALGPSLNDFWLSGRATLLAGFERIRALGRVLSDPASVATLDAVIRFRALDGDRPDPAADADSQYLPPDLPPFDRPIRFLDGGAYDGDTYRRLTELGVDISHWYAFEPDPASFARLVTFGKTCRAASTFLPCGLSDRQHQSRFASGDDTGSRMLDDASASATTIQCIAIDDVFADGPIDYVKLDIEGAERAALRGMQNTVRTHRPRLAVSAYHRPDDLWEVPLQLHAMLPDADIHLRHHCPNTFDVVAYAVPRRR